MVTLALLRRGPTLPGGIAGAQRAGHLLISLRNLLRNKIFVGINLFGMGIAIACGMVAYLTFMNHAGFDRMHTHVTDVFRVNAVRDVAGIEKRYGSVPVALGQMLKENAGDVKNIIRFSPSVSQFRVDNDDIYANLAYMDPAAFSVFSFEFIAGKPAALSNRAAIFLSESMSITLFGTTDALGKTVRQRLLFQATLPSTRWPVFSKISLITPALNGARL